MFYTAWTMVRRHLSSRSRCSRWTAAAGTTELVCTPHANRDYKFEPLVIRERLNELETGIGGATALYTGCDFHLS